MTVRTPETLIAQHLYAHEHEIFVDGRWIRGQGGRIDITNPATEEVIGAALDASPAEMRRAVAVARRSFDAGDWARRPLQERAAILERAVRLVEGRLEEFARLQTAQMGVPIT